MISIVTGTLDRVLLLPKIIENTLDQSDQLELVLIDGGSTDGTQDYIRSLNHPRIKLIEIGHRSNYGHYMNLGIEISKYEWICQWNDDVLLHNPWTDVFKLLDDPYDLFIFDWYRDLPPEQVYPPGIELSYFFCNLDKPKGTYGRCLSFGLYRKDVFRKIGMFDEKTFMYYMADSDMTERAFHFDYRIKACSNIRVKEMLVDKRACGEVFQEDLLMPCISNYYKGIIPNHIRFLA